MIPYGHQSIDDDDIAAVVGVLKGDWLTQGPTVAEFERALAIRSDLDEARLALAGVLERFGRTQEARVEYQRLAVGRATSEEVRRTALRRLALAPKR